MKHAFFVLMLLALAACASTVEQRGIQIDADKLKQIQIGQSSVTDVTALLGSPAATGSFGDITWYYIAQKMEYWAFRDPKIEAQDVIIIRFDKAGIVSAIDKKSLADAKAVAAVKQTTPSAESQLTVMQQLLGNVGRFSGKEGTK
jgi:outer membrane protein assembly factor BamE (lipoprotein component of BamABCDE complex)